MTNSIRLVSISDELMCGIYCIEQVGVNSARTFRFKAKTIMSLQQHDSSNFDIMSLQRHDIDD